LIDFCVGYVDGALHFLKIFICFFFLLTLMYVLFATYICSLLWFSSHFNFFSPSIIFICLFCQLCIKMFEIVGLHEFVGDRPIISSYDFISSKDEGLFIVVACYFRVDGVSTNGLITSHRRSNLCG